MLENEKAWRPRPRSRAGLLTIWGVMQACVERGCAGEGILPGGLKVQRRAPACCRDTAASEPERRSATR